MVLYVSSTYLLTFPPVVLMSERLTHVTGNCHPRALARLFEVQKDGPNKGKKFYRCARPAKLKCEFFLWEEKARARESGLTPSDKAQAGDEVVARTPGPSKTPKMTQKSLANYGYTRQRRNSDEITTSSGSDSETEQTPSKGKRKLDVFAEDPDSDSFGSLDSEDEQELAAMADETAKNPTTPAATRVVAGLPTPSTTRTLFPGATEGRSEKRQKTMAFDDLPETPSKPSSGASTATMAAKDPSFSSTKTVSFSPQPTSADDPIDAIMSILQPYSLSVTDTNDIRDRLLAEVRKKTGVEMARDGLRKQVQEKDAKIAKLQGEVAALKNKEEKQHRQITAMKAKTMRLYQDFSDSNYMSGEGAARGT